jgi:hypothetical protein
MCLMYYVHLVGIKEVIDCYGYGRLVVMHFVVSMLTGKCSVICIFVKGLTFQVVCFYVQSSAFYSHSVVVCSV